MKEFSPHYSIHTATMALCPGKYKGCETIALETDKDVRIQASSLDLIKQACLNSFSSYEGRRDAIMYYTNCKRKVPIPLRPGHVMFPTHAVKDSNCYWISYHHVLNIHPLHDQTNSKAQFKNGKQLILPISFRSLKNLIDRAAKCQHIIENRYLF